MDVEPVLDVFRGVNGIWNIHTMLRGYTAAFCKECPDDAPSHFVIHLTCKGIIIESFEAICARYHALQSVHSTSQIRLIDNLKAYVSIWIQNGCKDKFVLYSQVTCSPFLPCEALALYYLEDYPQTESVSYAVVKCIYDWSKH